VFTLQRNQRVLKSHEFRKVLRYGRRYNRGGLKIVVLRKTAGISRLGLTVSRKVGNSVIRNGVKRRIREVFRREVECFPLLWDVVVVAHPQARLLSFWEVRDLLKSVFSVLGGQKKLSGKDVVYEDIVKRNREKGAGQPKKKQ